MGKKINRKCIICNTQYHYCPTCGGDSSKPTWYFIFDGQNCHDIYDVCTKYRDGEIDVKTAYDLISKLDLSKLNDFAESTKLQIEEIMKTQKESTAPSVVEEKKVEDVKETSNDIKFKTSNTYGIKNNKKK